MGEFVAVGLYALPKEVTMKAGTQFLGLCISILLLGSCWGKAVNSGTRTTNNPLSTTSGFDMSRTKTETSVQRFEARAIGQSNTVVYLNGILIIGGGYLDQGLYRDRNDVLWSPDGSQWWKLAEKLIAPERNSYAIGILQNQVMVVGGKDTLLDMAQHFLFREDGFLVGRGAADSTSPIENLPARDLPALLAANDKMMIIGGSEKGNPVRTVFVVQNGKVVAQSLIPEVEGLLISVQAWSSYGAYYLTDSEGNFWKSSDGIAWRKLQVDEKFKNRSGYVVIPRGTQWYLAGGNARIGEDLSGLCNDVWQSSDEGKTWTLLTAPAEAGYIASEGAGSWGYYKSFSAREYPAGLVLQDKIVVGGGQDSSGDLQDFWASDDGITWTQLK
jgi:hypothetical protein